LDADDEKMLQCRTYQHAESYCNDPCDSRIIGVFTVQLRNSRIMNLSRRQLLRPAIMMEKEQGLDISSLPYCMNFKSACACVIHMILNIFNILQ
jgi:hypothetical protein